MRLTYDGVRLLLGQQPEPGRGLQGQRGLRPARLGDEGLGLGKQLGDALGGAPRSFGVGGEPGLVLHRTKQSGRYLVNLSSDLNPNIQFTG